MPQIKFTEIANIDVQRITEFMDTVAPEITDDMLTELYAGIGKLAQYPHIAKPSEEPKYQRLRELFVNFRSTGYWVLYEYREDLDLVLIASIRHSKENVFSI
jgi:plasmid stabilization system protein ParE